MVNGSWQSDNYGPLKSMKYTKGAIQKCERKLDADTSKAGDNVDVRRRYGGVTFLSITLI